MFNLLGYSAATLAWSSYRGPNLPAQPADLATAAANQVFSDQGAVVTAYIIAGYVSRHTERSALIYSSFINVEAE